jgi:Fe2+ transport system protein FeoA
MILDPDDWRAAYAARVAEFMADGREHVLRGRLISLGFRPGAQLDAEMRLHKQERHELRSRPNAR